MRKVSSVVWRPVARPPGTGSFGRWHPGVGCVSGRAAQWAHRPLVRTSSRPAASGCQRPQLALNNHHRYGVSGWSLQVAIDCCCECMLLLLLRTPASSSSGRRPWCGRPSHHFPRHGLGEVHVIPVKSRDCALTHRAAALPVHRPTVSFSKRGRYVTSPPYVAQGAQVAICQNCFPHSCSRRRKGKKRPSLSQA